MNSEQAKARAEVFKALGHPVRLLAVYALRNGERSVSDLHRVVSVAYSTLSRHLAVLKKAGVVSERYVGLRVMHRLVVPALLEALGPVDRVVAQRADRQARAV